MWCLRLIFVYGFIVDVFDFFAVVCLRCWLLHCGCSLYVRWFSGVFAFLVVCGVLRLFDLVVVDACLVWYDCVSY